MAECCSTLVDRRILLTSANEIITKRIEWLWKGRIPTRGLTVVAGEKGLGKSILTNAKLVADATTGTLDGDYSGRPIDVAVVTAEDGWDTVVRPRLEAHGADLERVHRLTVRDDSGLGLFTLPDDVHRLGESFAELDIIEDRRVELLVIDPIGAFLAQTTDSHKDAHVRRALAPLAALAEDMGIAVIVVAHLTKDDSQRLIQRVSGAGAFVNAARSVLGLVRAPDDPKGEQGCERVLAHVASNWGRQAPSLAARIEARDVDLDDGSLVEVGYLRITGETEITVDELQRTDEDSSDCAEAITSRLVDGPRSSREVKAEVAAELGCARKTVERHAVRLAECGDLVIESGGYPRRTTWRLPSRDSSVGTGDTVSRVPTEQTASASEKQTLNGDSRDSRDGVLTTSLPTMSGGAQDDPKCDCDHPVASENGDDVWRCEKCGGLSDE